MTLLWVGEGRLSVAGPLARCSAFVPVVSRPLSQLRKPWRLLPTARAARNASPTTVLVSVCRCTDRTRSGRSHPGGFARFT
jgi:hypothetical protein